jgi:hypothetical protein
MKTAASGPSAANSITLFDLPEDLHAGGSLTSARDGVVYEKTALGYGTCDDSVCG